MVYSFKDPDTGRDLKSNSRPMPAGACEPCRQAELKTANYSVALAVTVLHWQNQFHLVFWVQPKLGWNPGRSSLMPFLCCTGWPSL